VTFLLLFYFYTQTVHSHVSHACVSTVLCKCCEVNYEMLLYVLQAGREYPFDFYLVWFLY